MSRRRGLTIGKTRSALYLSARILGDYQAIKNGTVPQRVARRLIGRATSRMIGRLFR